MKVWTLQHSPLIASQRPYAEGNPDFLVGDEVLVSDTTTGVVVEVVPHAAPPRITLRMHGFAWDCRFAMA